jgi:hypothetical protein
MSPFFKTTFLTAALTMAAGAASAASVTYDGITFPEGSISFADKLIDLSFGSPAPTDVNFTDGSAALGAPDYTHPTGAVSLGDGGSITLEFVDNRLTGSNSSAADLHIFEVGPDVEDTFVEISKDGVLFHKVGKVTGGTKSIDIDQYGFGINDLFRFVRLIDDTNEGGQSGSTVGADIDAVGAISTTLAPVPLPATGLLLLAGLGGIALQKRRKA